MAYNEKSRLNLRTFDKMSQAERSAIAKRANAASVAKRRAKRDALEKEVYERRLERMTSNDYSITMRLYAMQAKAEALAALPDAKEKQQWKQMPQKSRMPSKLKPEDISDLKSSIDDLRNSIYG